MNSLIFISSENTNELFLRNSFVTQSIYLFINVFFFYFLINYLFKYGKEKVLRISYLSIFLFVIYGYFEFFIYMLTGQNSDFISNRITGEGFHYGLFQTINLAGMHFMRMKSLSGEPSMYAFTLLPFFILSIYMKRYKFAIFSFFTLIITTSTSAILGIVIYFIFDLIYRKNKLIKVSIAVLFIKLITFTFYDFINSLYSLVEAKISLQNDSGIVRFSHFSDHFTAWYNSDFINLLFGYGFGYVRSTDALTTLLFNVGIIGLFMYILFFIMPYFLIKNKTDYIKGLYISNFTLLIVMLISVQEFYYPHIWLFNALLWYEYLKEKREIKMLRQQHANN